MEKTSSDDTQTYRVLKNEAKPLSRWLTLSPLVLIGLTVFAALVRTAIESTMTTEERLSFIDLNTVLNNLFAIVLFIGLLMGSVILYIAASRVRYTIVVATFPNRYRGLIYMASSLLVASAIALIFISSKFVPNLFDSMMSILSFAGIPVLIGVGIAFFTGLSSYYEKTQTSITVTPGTHESTGKDIDRPVETTSRQ